MEKLINDNEGRIKNLENILKEQEDIIEFQRDTIKRLPDEIQKPPHCSVKMKGRIIQFQPLLSKYERKKPGSAIKK